jgi:hypothetical protein
MDSNTNKLPVYFASSFAGAANFSAFGRPWWRAFSCAVEWGRLFIAFSKLSHLPVGGVAMVLVLFAAISIALVFLGIKVFKSNGLPARVLGVACILCGAALLPGFRVVVWAISGH